MNGVIWGMGSKLKGMDGLEREGKKRIEERWRNFELEMFEKLMEWWYELKIEDDLIRWKGERFVDGVLCMGLDYDIDL